MSGKEKRGMKEKKRERRKEGNETLVSKLPSILVSSFLIFFIPIFPPSSYYSFLSLSLSHLFSNDMIAFIYNF